ncbi:hypothetical protein RHMOL_Rhmol04G0239200 [Rhododendron molle]|nr:hypothetical protein RHMOL_Rhmol04G0239200 [Rhododendron molle]
MVLYTCVCSTMLRTSEPSDRASDVSDLILAMNDSQSLVAEMRIEPSDTQSNSSKVRSCAPHCIAPTQSLVSLPHISILIDKGRAPLWCLPVMYFLFPQVPS